MSRPRKVCVVITARPSYSRIKTALLAIREHPDLELQLVVAASALLDRYGSAMKVIEADGFEIAARVYMVLEGENPAAMAKTTGLGVLELTTVFDNLRPDVVVTVADRYETLATAVASAYLNIPLAHVQGGEVTGSIDEKVRHAVTKLADIHLVSTNRAAERVIRMGEDPDMVFVTGCPSIDLACEVLESPALAFDPMQRYGGVGQPLDLSSGYIVVLQHPVTTEHERARAHVTETLFAARDSDVPALWFWPNPDAGSDGTSSGIRAFRENEQPGNIHFFKNMVPTDFLRLLYNSRCIVGNSSVGIRECSFLGVPAVNIGSRQAGRDRGRNVIDVDYDRVAIGSAIVDHFSNGRSERDLLYGNGRAGERIASTLADVPLRIEKMLRGTSAMLNPELNDILRTLDERPTPGAYQQAARALRDRPVAQVLPLRLALLASFTIEPLVPFLEVECARVGRGAAIYVGPFNAVGQELVDPASGCHTHQPHIVFVAQRLEELAPALCDGFLALSPSEWCWHSSSEEQFGDERVFADDLYLSWADARAMQSAGMVVGGHSHGHRPLSTLDEHETDADLKACTALLRERLSAQARWPFSYPYGKSRSFSQHTVEAVQSLGFCCACTTESGLNDAGVDRFRLRRFDTNDVQALEARAS